MSEQIPEGSENYERVGSDSFSVPNIEKFDWSLELVPELDVVYKVHFYAENTSVTFRN